MQDETGLRPRMFNSSVGVARQQWAVRTLGRFNQFENREVKWYPGELEPGWYPGVLPRKSALRCAHQSLHVAQYSRTTHERTFSVSISSAATH
eukprot:146503-Prymnesium_polylepis.1